VNQPGQYLSGGRVVLIADRYGMEIGFQRQPILFLYGGSCIMRSAYLILGLLLFVSVACSGQSAPSAPSNPSADLPSWSMKVDGVDYNFSMSDILQGRQTASVKPGTNMSPSELRVFYAVMFTSTNFPKAYWDRYCQTYKLFYAFFVAHSDAYMLNMVVVQESHGFDVPDKGPGVPPAPIC
jgi:hypothetical protein